MAKKISSILVAALLIMSCIGFTVLAQNQDIVVTIDSKVVDFPDAKPFINEDSRTLCPIRFIAENIGAEVKWDDEARTVSIRKDDTDILLTIGKNAAIVNGTEKTFDTVPQIFESRTYVPLRFISETLDMNVDWDNDTKTVIITSPEFTALNKAGHIDRYLTAMENHRGFSGSVLVAQEDSVIFSKAYGYANYEKQIKNTPETIFAIGSVTKAFTSMAIMQLYEKKLLDLDDKISKYIDDVVEGDKITIKNLLTHTSGLENFTDSPSLFTIKPEDISLDMVIGMFKEKPLKFEPGSDWQYNNSGYVLLGYIVEKVSGLMLDDYLNKNIFTPLKMENTGVFYGNTSKNMADGYSGYMDLKLVPEDKTLLKGSYGAGYIWSTVEDLYKWDRALYTEKLAKAETIDMIFDIHVEDNNLKGGYGLGWFILEDDNLGKVVYHGGNTLGFTSYLARYVDQDITIIITVNSAYYNVEDMNKVLIDIIKDKSYILPEELVEIKLDSEILNKYTGVYEYMEGFDVIITLNNDQLYAQLPAQTKVEIYPLSENEFFYKAINAFITFEKNQSSEITGIIFRQGQTTFSAKRKGDAPDERKVIELDKKIYKDYEGKYQLAPGFIITISTDGESLYAQATGQDKYEIFPMSKTEFFYKITEAQIEFTTDESGNVNSLILKQSGQELPAPKI